MKRILSKPSLLVCVLALFLSLSNAIGSKQVQQGRYKQSNLGSTCFPLTTLPEVCTPTMTGIICTTAFGTATRTWYSDACVTPYYEWP